MEGDYRLGDKIPTEKVLTEALHVSRSTLREGLQLLEEERILVARHGSGRYLITPLKDIKVDITELKSVTRLLEDYEIRWTTKVLQVQENPADDLVATKLGIQPGNPVLKIERILYIDDLPILYSIDILSKRWIIGSWQDLDFKGSLFDILEGDWGVRLDHARTTIGAVLYDEGLANRVEVNQFIPWILLEQVDYNQDEQPVIYSKEYHRADYLKIHLTRYRRY